jgi:hypothetical protein
MGSADFFKSAVDSLDKITDILNVGRLIFYTTAGFCALLPAAMILHMMLHFSGTSYSSQFIADLIHCAKLSEVWIAALVFGFVIASVAFASIIDGFAAPPPGPVEKDSYSYAYPRLFSGGFHKKDGTAKDYAAWLISEYYRYVEIVVFIPFSILLSLPVYWLYTLIYMIRTSQQSEPFVLHGVHVAFALWTLGTAAAWMVVWPNYWLPRVAEPIYQGWVEARREAIAGLEDFIQDKTADLS